MRKSRVCGLAPINKIKRRGPKWPPIILSLPRCSHPALSFISNTFTRQCLRRVVFRLDQVVKGRVVLDGFIQNRIVWGRVIRDRVSQDAIFERRVVMGQIVQKRIVKNRVVLGQILQSVYTKQNCRESTRQNQAFRILNTEKKYQ